jgi:hypothetical protein
MPVQFRLLTFGPIALQHAGRHSHICPPSAPTSPMARNAASAPIPRRIDVSTIAAYALVIGALVVELLLIVTLS